MRWMIEIYKFKNLKFKENSRDKRKEYMHLKEIWTFDPFPAMANSYVQ